MNTFVSLDKVVSEIKLSCGNVCGEWSEYSASNYPSFQGLYAIYSVDYGWFYCGKSSSIAKRFNSPTHPIHIANSLDGGIYLFCLEVSDKLSKCEKISIKTLSPLGNGGTSFDNFSYYKPYGFNSVNPYQVCAHGHWCKSGVITKEDIQLQAEVDMIMLSI